MRLALCLVCVAACSFDSNGKSGLDAGADAGVDGASVVDSAPVDGAPVDGVPVDGLPSFDGGLPQGICSFDELQPVAQCGFQNCSAQPTVACLLTQCPQELLSLSPQCGQCILTQTDLQGVLNACILP